MTNKMTTEEEINSRKFQQGVTTTQDGTSSLLDLIIKRYKANPKEQLYGIIQEKKVLWKTAEDFLSEAFLLSLNLRKFISPNEPVGIFSINKYEWVLAQHGIYLAKGIDCPLYSTFGVSAIKHVISQSEMKTCFVSGEKASYFANEVLKNGKSSLKHLIAFEDFKEKEELEKKGIKVSFLKEMLFLQKMEKKSEIIEKNLKKNENPKPEDICTICYTSGTTGNPKGVILTHKNFISILAAFERSQGDFLPKFTKEDVHLSFLPLTHILERISQMVFIHFGGKVIFYSGIISNLSNDLQIAKPTILPGVPQIFGRIKKEIEKKIKERGKILQFFFNLALKYKIKKQKRGIYTSSFFDSIFFDKIKEKFGGKIRAFLGGGSLIEPDQIRFMQACFSCKMYIGYGSTETTGVISCTSPSDFLYDSIGLPFPCTKVKLVEVADLPGKYEIWAKGDSIFQGYYKNEETTKEAFTDGWFMTGDLAKYENKVLKIVGRKKDIFKTSRAEYVAPEKLESLFMIQEIDDILVTGRASKGFIVAVAVCLNDLTDEDIKRKIMEKAKKAFEEKEIPKYEIPGKILVRRESFDSLGDVRTPTLKKKRGLIEEKLKNEIDCLFEDE